ncbi:hypothetical protein EJB05_40400 [Eragrostis curvula]|uniref:MBD domain-containing protein n=1 Tax=Eragrostis curvula TaxID=38414 RepID=A0A5J9TR53_9POAL|nr:hypothetical protein EJB05_40400 [Eragrostis curvula]
MVSTRRSVRSGGGPVPPEEAPSEPASVASSLTVSRRRARDASPPGTPGSDREIGGLHNVVVIPDEKTLKQPVEAKKHSQGNEVVVVEEPDEESLEEPPGWLPDGWIMEAHGDDNSSIYQYYTSPMSGYTFSSKVETLDYLFSGMDERFLESKACAEENDLHKSHTWLPGGWVIEVRAGGKEMDKMYKQNRMTPLEREWGLMLAVVMRNGNCHSDKLIPPLQFYVHLPTGKRFLFKRDVLRYANKGMVSRLDTEVLCDTSTDDNILAHLEFSPDGLPDGWVKEVIFRKCNDGIRKDPYYTDPVSHHVFRTLRSVLSYLKNGEISRHAYMPRRSVTDMYSFDICADLVMASSSGDHYFS